MDGTAESGTASLYWLLLAVLTVWRITHLLTEEDGPWDVVVGLRRRAGRGFWGRLLDCSYCLSLWVAVPLAAILARTVVEGLLLWPALSAGALLLERATSSTDAALPELAYHENEEVPDVLLRRKQTAAQDDGSAGT